MQTLDIVHFILLLIALVLSAYKLLQNPSLVLIPAFLLLLLLAHSYAAYLKSRGINNLYIYHILTPVEYALFAVVFMNNIKSRTIRKIIQLTIPIVMVMAYVFARFFEGLESNNSYNGILSNVLMVYWCLFYLLELLKDNTNSAFFKIPFSWICIGLLFYNTGNLITQGTLNYLMERDMHFASVVYNFSYIFSFLLFSSIIVASIISEKSQQGI